jgi:hypothetical protein
LLGLQPKAIFARAPNAPAHRDRISKDQVNRAQDKAVETLRGRGAITRNPLQAVAIAAGLGIPVLVVHASLGKTSMLRSALALLSSLQIGLRFRESIERSL